MNRRDLIRTTGTFVSLSTLIRSVPVQGQTPVAADMDPWVFGRAFYLLDAGEVGSFVIVYESPISQNGRQIVVFRNNTPNTVAVDEVYGVARDSADALVGTSTDATIAPRIVEPNGLCLVYVEYDDLSASSSEQDGLTFEYETQEYDSIERSNYGNLRVVELNFTDNRILGTVENTGTTELLFPQIIGLLMNEDGSSPIWFKTYTQKDQIAPGDKSAFSVDASIPDEYRDNYLFAASGLGG